MFRICGVTKTYDDKVAVAGIDLDIPAGSVFGLIGPNGAGKTTLLKMLSTLSKPDSGHIELDGADIETDVRKARSMLGYMPDQFGTFRGLDCRGYLEFFGRAYGAHGTALKRSIDDILDLTDLSGVQERPTTGLSTGMKQRLSLAKTLLHDPKVLLLDEPSSGLDPRARIEVRSLLKELSGMGKTIVISSHILADLEEICSDVAIIEEGKLVWTGSLARLTEAESTGTLEASLEVASDDLARTRTLLEAIDGVTVLASTPTAIDLQLAGRIGNQVLAALIESDIEVRAFHVEKVRLEKIFLERTRGIVS